MKSIRKIFAVAAAVATATGPAVVVAQAGYFPGQPDCAVPCLTSAITKAGCQLGDVSCQCGPTQGSIGAIAATCLLSACDLNEVGQAQSAGSAVCQSLSDGDLDLPTSSTIVTATTTTDDDSTMTTTVSTTHPIGSSTGFGGSSTPSSTTMTTPTTTGTGSGTRIPPVVTETGELSETMVLPTSVTLTDDGNGGGDGGDGGDGEGAAGRVSVSGGAAAVMAAAGVLGAVMVL